MPLFSTNPDFQLGPSTLAAGQVTSDTPMYRAPLYLEMMDRWNLCRDVFMGTEAIRWNSSLTGAGGKTYLPQHPAETDDQYQARISRAECFPGFQHSVKGLASIVFRNDPELQDDVPKEIVDLAENIDGNGNHIVIFLRMVFEEAMTVGHSFILVDMPKAPDLGRPLTMAEERSMNLTPSWIHIAPEQVYSWRTEIVNGVVTLIQIVIHEQINFIAGVFATGVESRYRVFKYDPVTGIVSFEIWVQDASNIPILQEEGIVRGVNRIPIVPIYGGMRRGPLHSMPPLLDLAYANISHCQVLTDHRYALYLSSVPLLVFKGRPPQQMVDAQGNALETTIGPNIAIDVAADGDVKYVEHSGAALGETRQELKDLEARMAALGMSALQHETRLVMSAESKRMDKTEKDAAIAVAARSMLDAAEQCLDFTAQFLGYAPDSGGSIYLDMDFNIETMDAQTMSALTTMVSNGQLSIYTMWEVLKNRGILPEDMDADVEMERIQGANMLPSQGTDVPGVATDTTNVTSTETDASGRPVAVTTE